MPEYRQDLTTGQWVIIATDRAKRPETFAGKKERLEARFEQPPYRENCPFCMGNETLTPPEIIALGRDSGAPDTPGWRVRVIPNKYPAVEPKGNPRPEHRPGEAIFRDMPGYGIHEVLVETPRHNLHPGSLGREQMELVVESYYQRFQHMSGDNNLRYVQIFRNHGREAGASIEHPHSQLIALPIVPPVVKQELQRSHDYYLSTEGCPYCHALAEEMEFGSRVVADNRFFSAYVPYAAHLPFEVWIMPKQHRSSFQEISKQEMSDLAEIMDRALGRLSNALDDPPYNFYLHSSPLRTSGLPYYHWHIVIIPKLTTVAGFEMGSGVFINVTVPEQAAEFLREKGGEVNGIRPKDLLCPGSA